MKNYRSILLDLDGCVYRGNQIIVGVREALRGFRERGVKILFLTNNSTMTSEGYAEKLRVMGIESVPEEFLTSGEAASHYILMNSGPSNILPITENGFKDYCRRMNHKVLEIKDWRLAEYVVVGLDRNFNYMKLRAACRAIMNGAIFIATNVDRTIPTEDGLDPGAGSIVAAIREATLKEPIVIGKPSKIMMELALHKVGVSPSEILVIGDRLETDILAGKVIGADTALLLSGATTRDAVERAPPQNKPDYVAENLLELYKNLVRLHLI
jgi:4-nitrophenyl phosphatase